MSEWSASPGDGRSHEMLGADGVAPEDEVAATSGGAVEPDDTQAGSAAAPGETQGGREKPDDVGASTVAARERDEYLDALRRVQADFENYKKRILKQQTEHLERAASTLVEKLLPVLDTLDLAVAHAAGGEGDAAEHEALVKVAAMLGDVLSKEGLERVDPLGQPFDPSLHDAVMHEDGDDGPVVSEVFRAGYLWKGRVIRPAMVKVTG